MYPTDVVKTRQQLSTSSESFLSVLRSIIREEGLSNLYRGVAAPIFAEAPKRAIKFSFNEKYKNILRDDEGNLPFYGASMAGAFAGMTECSLNTPAEVISKNREASRLS